MTPISRLWIAFAAIGAGTIHLAVGASAPVLLSIAYAGLGSAELGWGVATLVRGRFLFAGQALFGFLVPVAVWVTATTARAVGLPPDATVLPVFPMAVATLFGLFVSGSLAVARRRSPQAGRPDTVPAPRGGVSSPH